MSKRGVGPRGLPHAHQALGRASVSRAGESGARITVVIETGGRYGRMVNVELTSRRKTVKGR